MNDLLTVLCGDALTELRKLPAESVHCCVTSPPYWGLRDYSANGQLGLEKTPEIYVAKMVEVFREVRRVLRKDGTLWLNMGDSYASAPAGNKEWKHGAIFDGRDMSGHHSARASHPGDGGTYRENKPAMDWSASGLKQKDLCGIPWRVAFALQADGWVLRSDIIWAKCNPMPESVTDRPTKSHEYLFLFSKARWCGEDRRRFADISDDDARWLALFLDTEGNICCKRVKMDGRGDHFGAQICFASSSRNLIDTAQRIIGAGAVLTRKGKNAPMFYVQLSNNQATDLLHRLWQFLIVKQRQASLAIYLQNVIADSGHERRTKIGRLRGRARGDEYTNELIRIWATMKQLNHFGNPDLSWMPQPKFGRWDSESYFYDAEAIREPASPATEERDKYDRNEPRSAHFRHGSGYMVQPANAETKGGRNKRSVWTVATAPYPEAHFATYPPDLIKPCILAGTSAKGCCAKCGGPWDRIVERGLTNHDGDTNSSYPEGTTANRLALLRQAARQRGEEYRNESKTIGWQPTAYSTNGATRQACKCEEHPIVPATILDPFAGSGTTGAVALELGRRAILIELNPKYVELIRQRCNVTPGLALA